MRLLKTEFFNRARGYPVSHFFAYMARMSHIQRWGLMRCSQKENIQEHSLQVAMIAHGLALIRFRIFGEQADPERTALLALYHDVSEVITGDLPTPIKHFSPEIKSAYSEIEEVALKRLHEMLPEELQEDFGSIFQKDPADEECWALVKAADKLCAYLKCLEEIKAANQEFVKAEKSIKADLLAMRLPEVGYFLDTFVPSFELTLDEMD
jgi:5'-deoxynucleotidase